jgi:hypothetical protein
MRVSHDRRRFYVMNANMEDMEVVDIPGRRSSDTFRLSHDDTRVRVLRSFEADPLDRFLLLVTKAATRRSDRFEIGPPQVLKYDLAAHRSAGVLPWPNGEEREFAAIRMSPDGRLLYYFADEVVIYDTVTLKQVDTWNLAHFEPGLGRVSLGGSGRGGFGFNEENEEPGFYTGLFTIQDPVQSRRILGLARVNLQAKSFEFTPLGPASPVGAFALAPGRKLAYGLVQQVGLYELWTFDLEKRRVASKVEFQGRPRMALKTSSNGKLLYVYQAGNTIDLFEAATSRYLRTIRLEGDMTTELFVFSPETERLAGAARN